MKTAVTSYGEYNGLTENFVNAHHQSLVNVNWDFEYATVLGPPFSFLTYVFFLHVARETRYFFQWETRERNIDEVAKRRHSTILSLQHEGSRYVLFTFLSLPLIINVNSFAEFFSFSESRV